MLLGATAAVGREDKHTNASPHQLHLPVGPAADQLHSVKVGELHLQLLQLTGRLLICRVDTVDTAVNGCVQGGARESYDTEAKESSNSQKTATLIQCSRQDLGFEFAVVNKS